MITGRWGRRLFNSPTATSWISYALRAAALPITLPLLLTRLSAAELNVWYLTAMILSFVSLSDLGFSHTFYRLIAWGMSGAEREDILARSLALRADTSEGKPNWDIIGKIFSTMFHVYLALGMLLLLCLLTAGSYALLPAIDALPNARQIWAIWPVIAILATLTFIGSIYAVYLQGANCIAQMRRWDAAIQIPATLTLVIILVFRGGVIPLLIAQQAWGLAGVFRNYQISRIVHEGRFRNFRITQIDGPLFRAAFRPSWRTGIGAVASLGGTRLSIIFFSRLTPPDVSASFLFAMNLMDKLVDFSMVPFYVKIPTFAALTFRRARAEITERARRAMALSHLCLVVPGILIGILAPPLLRLIGSHIEFIDPAVWAALLLGIWSMREGAMHIQLYSTTNHIIWHWVNGLSSIVLVAIVFSGADRIGIWAIPLAYALAFGAIYMPISVRYSLRFLETNLFSFERWNVLFPAALLLFFGTTLLLK